ncbi:hypothetical protein BV25DRAFT_1915892 [Artomyces pyxidatus]|uniref:Uncharacterized protein n=1 Tax=Artomyces pyxidatus TaxID=48021 RepID=A0ACB8T447_9AGAM|nr:hypothetical protein BV25DRAFT_1915892 [Artomyces pyxidatus]
MLFLVPFVCAALAQRGSGSPVAVPTATSFSLADAPVACTNIEICRTRYNIVWSSLVTILACVWTAVHRNIPASMKARESRLRYFLARVFEIGMIVMVTLLVPEWILAWALRQLLNARAWERKRALLQGGKCRATERKTTEIGEPETIGSAANMASEEFILLDEVSPAVIGCHSEKKWDGEQPLAFEESKMVVDERAGRLSSSWTTRHGFFVVMGGFHFYDDGEPKHPLSPGDVVELVRSGDLVPPTEDEIRGWSQGDALSKALAVVQTLWFVVQCVSRHVEGLPITQLEVMTLAYAIITVAMYVAWWAKPQNVSGPVRITVKYRSPDPELLGQLEWYGRILNLIVGAQDNIVDLRKQPCVPTFYGGSTINDDNNVYGDIIALAIAMVFGAVHCAAWHYAFPSPTEQLIWRISSVAAVAVPGELFFVLLALWSTDSYRNRLRYISLSVFFSFCLYIVSRVLLLTLSFTTLRDLPYDAYKSVQWTLLIPHFT